MIRYAVLAATAMFGLATMCPAETWKNVALVDTACAAKATENPDAHTRECAVACAKSGFGIVTSDGSYLKFDASGNEKALAALKSSQKKDHLRATVRGDREGQIIKVASLQL